ncbi:peptidoglycan-recognition protein SC2-like [Dreissena polymorpha]|uniref:peptidoglycan-recognition protein SC2-like n=1 Tax=Dreissena polymorpha TaxID=45954 RepID=UPI002263F3A5|nr:peptidoglycan-recognition protein SC2-like [Dreissena polymorpha]
MFFIHHTVSRACTTKARCIGIVRGIQNDHIDHRGFDDIGYSFLVGGDGNVYEGRGWSNVGAHTENFNSRSFAAAMIGNFEATLPNAKAVTAVKNLIAFGVHLGKIARSYRLHGHRDVKVTACPGTNFYNLVKTWPNYRRYEP